MRKIYIVFAGLVLLLLAACSTATKGNPNEVLQTFFEHLAKKDIDGASKYVTADSKATMQMMKKGLQMAETIKDSLPQNDLMKDFEDVNFSEARIMGDSALITVSSKSNKRPAADFKLLKESNGWKVDFSMSTLMKMGRQTITTGSTEISDSIKTNEAEIEKGMKAADSLLKNMDPEMLNELQKNLEKLK